MSAEPADSDAAIILSRAIDHANRAAPDGREAILQAALRQADEARRFTIHDESPLPEGWPRPSLQGLIRIKTYSAVRSAWVRAPQGSNSQFMVLFRHIEERQIAMTAPVVMEYPPAAVADSSETGPADAMAFLYRRVGQGQTGQDGKVLVEDDPPVTVVSMGLKGSYRQANFKNALADLRRWLDANPEWKEAGPPRVLAYNSPFMPFWKKYSEVQIPVQASVDGNAMQSRQH